MKKIKLFALVLIIIITSIVIIRYYKTNDTVAILKNNVIIMSDIIKKDSLSTEDKNKLDKIENTNWDLLFDGKNQKNLDYILISNDIAENINIYFNNKNLKAKETSLKQIEDMKKVYNIN